MKEITTRKNENFLKIAKKTCNITERHSCIKDFCYCALQAETKAYYDMVIPKGFEKNTIYNFNNRNKDNQILDQEIALRAKKSLIDYCWNGLSILDVNSKTLVELDKYSTIYKKYKEGKNVVIYADSERYNNSELHGNESKGRTFCASIIIKEAINNRMVVPNGNSWTFDWITFPTLDRMIIDNEERTLGDIKSSDWLVIDDISKNTRPYMRHRFDSFLMQRFSDGLPTIFVCRFDIRDNNSETLAGIAMSKIFKDSNTHFIALQK